MAEEDVKTKTLIVHSTDGEFKIDIPAEARLTFGPTVPYQKKDLGYQAARGWSLRVYMGTNLIAVFSDVLSFHDSSIPVYKLVVRREGKSVWESDEKGMRYEKHEVKRDTVLINALEAFVSENE